ncbi:DUF2591 family protein [Lelliottia sp. V89_10]|uniref:phage protein NinX family protein n=1 Tax=Lelliottia wanjuensis TaxID=3050585 RepID=UPI00249E9D24|nr:MULTISPECIES: phage protein NinX family protein [unclassified Lelliottia]MDI3361198.1 DUF2591 family protein [Lelliottia sp. V89_13]MDK9551297.1 DUF2591 family protein [Lelliottia sp. V89_5]MDK9597431.1 DUF2591 family protein [Lelliottia sp. V89_10]
MDYSKMSDQEINMAVAEILFPERPVIESKSRPPSACITGHLPSQWVDYCNNPADAWPIIVSNLISVEPDYEFIDPSEEQVFASGAWIAEHYDGKGALLQSVDINPLRAAMIVFLMIQGSANVQDNPA